MVDKEGLIVLKDGFSAFLLLWWADEYSAATAEAAVVEWASLFGVPSILVTDGGSHFDNQLIGATTRRFRARHHITTAYSPWANGIVERVNRELVRLWKVLMGEVGLPKEDWAATLRPLVQAIINRSPSAVLDGLSPAEEQFARKPQHPLDTIAFSKLADETKSTCEEID
jgi:transposase InsO family protein